MSCESACGRHPALVRNTPADNVVYVESEPEARFSRRGLLKGVGAALATVGLSSASSIAYAAAVVTTKTYTLTNAKTDRKWPKVGTATGYVIKMDVAKFDDKGRVKIEREDTFIIVTQPKTGVFRAFKGYCTHQLRPLDSWSGTNLVCRQHGATFDMNSGNNTMGPRNFGGKTVPALRSYPLAIDPKTGIVTITADATGGVGK